MKRHHIDMRVPTKMRSWLRSLLVTGATLLPIAFASSAQAWEMRVCADPNAPPFSTQNEDGFENRIAEALAEELGATLTYEWYPQITAMITDRLRTGHCDIIIGAAANQDTVLSTLAYYRSPFVFVYRADEDYDIRTFDDDILADLRIGVQPADGPAELALSRRGLGDNIAAEFAFAVGEEPLEPAMAAVANGTIDVAVVWGPAAGYYADQQDVELVVQPTPPFEPPATAMYINIGIGVRLGDESLRDLLDIALVNRWDEIIEIMAEYAIPTMPLPKPTLTLEVPQ